MLRGARTGPPQALTGLATGLLALAVAACVNVTVMAPPSASTVAAPPIACDSPGTGRIFRFEKMSMQPTLEPGDEVLVVSKDNLARGDIVVFSPPPAWVAGTTVTPFIKRVTGLPGETVEVKDGAVWVNGTKLDEPYVYDQQPTTAMTDEPARWVVPTGQLFVLGDHRAASADSRSFGTIAASTVLGVAVRRCSPSEAPLQ
jgi:signal peptidase I